MRRLGCAGWDAQAGMRRLGCAGWDAQIEPHRKQAAAQGFINSPGCVWDQF